VSSLRNARLKHHKAPRAQSVLTPRQTSPAVASCSQMSSQHASKSNPSRPTKRAHSHGRLRRAGLSACLTMSHLALSVTVSPPPNMAQEGYKMRACEREYAFSETSRQLAARFLCPFTLQVARRPACVLH